MKVIEKIIKYDDYNYVEGMLQFKAYGVKIRETRHGEQFSIDSISSVKLDVSKKILAPKVPSGINKNKVSSLYFPDKIITIINKDHENPYLVNYDEIIVDDEYVDDNLNIKGNRFYTSKNGTEISSTIEIKVYALIKVQQERVEKSYLYEVNKKISGEGNIEIFPEKDYYENGEKIVITVDSESLGKFEGWGNGDNSKKKKIEFTFNNEDIDIEAEFSEKDTKNFKDDKQNFQNSLETKKRASNSFFNNKNNSFWDIIGLIITVLIAIVIIGVIISIFGKALLFFIIGALLIWLITLVPRGIFHLEFFKKIFTGFFVLLLIVGLVVIIKNTSNHSVIKPIIPKKTEVVKENKTTDYIHHVKWKDYGNREYETDLIINSDVVNYSSRVKNSLSNINSESSYNKMLSFLNNKSQDSYVKISPKMDSLQVSNSLNEKEYAEMIVSMVQSIPYYAIVDKGCNPYEYQDKMLRDLLSENPCEGYQKHGIKTPAEFLKNLKGDCDTRTLFLYGLLKEVGFDVAIFGSQKYGHSILGINLNTNQPHYKTHKNKKYYLWEVTAKNFKPGKLPKSISNLNYWSLNLN